MSFTNPLPKIGLVPLFILWLGIGEPSKIAVIAAGAVFPILINTYNGVRGVNKLWTWRAATMGANQAEMLIKVIVPAALPQILTGARLGMALSWVILLAAEMVASRSGLGFRILYGQQMFDNTPVHIPGLLTIALFGFLYDRLILAISLRLCRWYFRLGNDPGAGGWNDRQQARFHERQWAGTEDGMAQSGKGIVRDGAWASMAIPERGRRARGPGGLHGSDRGSRRQRLCITSRPAALDPVWRRRRTARSGSWCVWGTTAVGAIPR